MKTSTLIVKNWPYTLDRSSLMVELVLVNDGLAGAPIPILVISDVLFIITGHTKEMALGEG